MSPEIKTLVIGQVFATLAGALIGYMAIREDMAVLKTQVLQHEKILDKLEQKNGQK